MKYTTIKRHLTPYSIYARRKTTINHAFASAIAPCDEFDEKLVRSAVEALGQNPDDELQCVYCGAPAETWDHVFATVEKSEFSGAGHRLGNLLPCCKPCNSKKGNKSWNDYMDSIQMQEGLRKHRKRTIQAYVSQFFHRDSTQTTLPEYSQLIALRDKVIRLMQQADILAKSIRDKAKGV